MEEVGVIGEERERLESTNRGEEVGQRRKGGQWEAENNKQKERKRE